MVEQWNSDCRAVWLDSGTVMVEQWNSVGGTVKQTLWNSGTVMVELCVGTVEQ